MDLPTIISRSVSVIFVLSTFNNDRKLQLFRTMKFVKNRLCKLFATIYILFAETMNLLIEI